MRCYPTSIGMCDRKGCWAIGRVRLKPPEEIPTKSTLPDTRAPHPQSQRFAAFCGKCCDGHFVQTVLGHRKALMRGRDTLFIFIGIIFCGVLLCAKQRNAPLLVARTDTTRQQTKNVGFLSDSVAPSQFSGPTTEGGCS